MPDQGRHDDSRGYYETINIGILNLPFDSFDLEALDRLAQGGESFDFAQDREPVERLVEPFEIWFLVLAIFMIFIKQVTFTNSVNYLFK